MSSWLRRHQRDVLLIGALLLLSGALTLGLFLTRRPGARVTVTVDGEPVVELPLEEDAQILLGEGEDTNLLVIADGSAQVTRATCPDGICVRRGAIRYEGESIVCLPHRLVIAVTGGRYGGFDAASG